VRTPLEWVGDSTNFDWARSQHVSIQAKDTILSTLSDLRLVSDWDISVQTRLLPILYRFVESRDLDGLQQREENMYRWICDILCNIASRHSSKRSTNSSRSALSPNSTEVDDAIAALVRLLDVPNATVIRGACSALARIARRNPFNEQLLRSEAGPALIALSRFVDAYLTQDLTLVLSDCLR
jgi:hypothetical protein